MRSGFAADGSSVCFLGGEGLTAHPYLTPNCLPYHLPPQPGGQGQLTQSLIYFSVQQTLSVCLMGTRHRARLVGGSEQDLPGPRLQPTANLQLAQKGTQLTRPQKERVHLLKGPGQPEGWEGAPWRGGPCAGLQGRVGAGGGGAGGWREEGADMSGSGQAT